MDGKLLGIAKSVDLYNSDFCMGFEEDRHCFQIVIPHIGYFVPAYVIRDFLLSTEFNNRFNYLK